MFDVNGDGVPDIVCGRLLVPGARLPEEAPRRRGQARAGEYYDDFSTIAMDVNGDGRLDFVTGGWWGNTLRWRENPGDPKKEWPEHVIAETGNVETTRAWDIDGDGELEIVPNTPGATEVASTSWNRPQRQGHGRSSRSTWSTSSPRASQGHGLGCGDIAGNGRMDFVLTNGWLEAPRGPVEGAVALAPGLRPSAAWRACRCWWWT